jgi:hypothetical protein
MEDIRKAFQRQFLLIAACCVIVLSALTWASTRGILPPRGFAILALIVAAATFAAFYARLRWFQRACSEYRRSQISLGVDAASFDREQCLKGIRALRKVIAFLVVALIIGLCFSKGKPLGPTLAGMTIDLLITGTYVHSLLRLRKKLKAIDSKNDTPDRIKTQKF